MKVEVVETHDDGCRLAVSVVRAKTAEVRSRELKEEKSNRGEDTAASMELFCKGS